MATTTPQAPVKLTWYPVEDYTSANAGATPFVIKEGDPINGRIVGNYADLGTANYHCRLHNQHQSHNYALNELEAMFQSEIHFGLAGFWDGGIEWHLGLELSDCSAANGNRGNEPTVEEAIVAMTNAARALYPESTFARGRGCDITLHEDQRSVEDLSYELHAAIGAFDLNFDASATDPYEPHWALTPAQPALIGLEGIDALGGYSAGEILREALDRAAGRV